MWRLWAALCFQAIPLEPCRGWPSKCSSPWLHVTITQQLWTSYIRLCGDEAQALGFVTKAPGDFNVEPAVRTTDGGKSEGQETSQDLPRQGWEWLEITKSWAPLTNPNRLSGWTKAGMVRKEEDGSITSLHRTWGGSPSLRNHQMSEIICSDYNTLFNLPGPREDMHW